MWLFELNQRQSEQYDSVFPVVEQKIGDLDPKIICAGPLQPKIAAITHGSITMNISNCILPPHDKIEVRIVGKVTIDFEATYDGETHIIQCEFRWYDIEPVAVFVVLDDVAIPGHFEAHFVDPSKTISDIKTIGVEVDNEFTQITLDFSECEDQSVGGNGLTNFTATYIYKTSGLVVVRTHEKVSGSDIVNYQIEENNFEGHIQFSLSNESCQSIAMVKLKNDADGNKQCDEWYEEEQHNNYETCEKELARWYGCPRQFDSRLIDGVLQNDSYWAELEVNFGMIGWDYDICCSPRSQKMRQALHVAHYCDSHRCSFNDGADFCIRSPRHACSATISGQQRTIFVSNQCCYFKGTLLDSENHVRGPYIAGRMHKEQNSVHNLPGHFWQDLNPFKQCCVLNPPYSPECIEKFKVKRKTINGKYRHLNNHIQREIPVTETTDERGPFDGRKI